MVARLALSLLPKNAEALSVTVDVDRVLLLGYTGRDRAMVVQHIEELSKLGVAPPPRVPMIYTVSPDLLTTAASITVDSDKTAGEVEVYLVRTPTGLCVGVGSDHTDREQEAVDVAYSKGLCPKVLSREVWLYADVADHWDTLELRAWCTVDGARRLYQEGLLSAFAPVSTLLAEAEQSASGSLAQTLFFGGTLPLIGGFAYAQEFEAEVRDPQTGRKLVCSYTVRA